MDITPLVPKNKNLIHAYGKDYVLIKQQKYSSPILITPDQIILNFFDLKTLNQLISKPEILLIGHHQQQMRLPSESILYLNQLHVSGETMSFGAACRTYNILLTEGREVAVWLLVSNL